jgi:hypothetical protein
MQYVKCLRALLACGIAILVLAAPAQAQDSTAQAGGWGALAAVGTLIYSPLKVVYAVGGLLFGGIAYGLSAGDSDVLHAVITPAVRGDYVLSPAHLRGQEPLEFFGRDPGYQPMDVAAEPRGMEDDF